MTVPVAATVLGAAVFAATDIDDLFVLVGFFSDPKFRPGSVVLGQYVGIAALVLLSAAAALVALVIPATYTGYLGLAPIAIGIKKLIDFGRAGSKTSGQREQRAAAGALTQLLTVAVVTFANGADNLAVYIPVFVIHSRFEVSVIIATFAFMTALWCALAHWLVHHPTLGAPIRRYGHWLLPFVLIGLGLWIIVKAGTFGPLTFS